MKSSAHHVVSDLIPIQERGQGCTGRSASGTNSFRTQGIQLEAQTTKYFF